MAALPACAQATEYALLTAGYRCVGTTAIGRQRTKVAPVLIWAPGSLLIGRAPESTFSYTSARAAVTLARTIAQGLGADRASARLLGRLAGRPGGDGRSWLGRRDGWRALRSACFETQTVFLNANKGHPGSPLARPPFGQKTAARVFVARGGRGWLDETWRSVPVT
jgi:hypothetical protein